MPVSYLPVPDGYIVWREGEKYYAAKRPELMSIVLSGRSRTDVLMKLYTRLQREAKEDNK